MATPPPRPTPGDILHDALMVPAALTPAELARAIDLPEASVADVVAGRAPISDDLAHRLAEHFGTTAELWLNLQFSHDVIAASLQLLQTRVPAAADRALLE